MSIQVDTNLAYIQTKLGISQEIFAEKYANKSVTEIITEEAKRGNQQAIALASELLNNVNLVMEIFSLANPENRIEIMSEMTDEQLNKFLPEMEKNDLVQGLNFFTQDKLLKMLEGVEPEYLVKVVLEMFSKEEVMRLLPEEQLDKLLTSTDMDKNKLLEHLKTIPAEYISQMIESVTGEEFEDGDKLDMLKTLSGFNPLEFKDALLNMQSTPKQQLVLSLTKEHEEYMQLFDANAYTNMINTYKDKSEVTKSMNILEQEDITEMIKELPEDLLALVITQMDTDKFAEILMKKNPEVMAQIIAGSN